MDHNQPEHNPARIANLTFFEDNFTSNHLVLSVSTLCNYCERKQQRCERVQPSEAQGGDRH
jgi:hypothetical protein